VLKEWKDFHVQANTGRAYFDFPTTSTNHTLSYKMQIYSIIAQLRIGHGFMKATRHTHSQNINETLCRCGEPESRDHILLHCDLLLRQRKQFLLESIRGRHNINITEIRDVLFKGVGRIASFIENSPSLHDRRWLPHAKGKLDPPPPNWQQTPRDIQLGLLSIPSPPIPPPEQARIKKRKK